jgi:hypothetical protein
MIKEGSVALQGGEEKKSQYYPNTKSTPGRKVFGKKWITVRSSSD